MCGQGRGKKRKSKDLGWGCHVSLWGGGDELSAGHSEFEIPQGHPACQVVGYVSRKLRDNGASTGERQ